MRLRRAEGGVSGPGLTDRWTDEITPPVGPSLYLESSRLSYLSRCHEFWTFGRMQSPPLAWTRFICCQVHAFIDNHYQLADGSMVRWFQNPKRICQEHIFYRISCYFPYSDSFFYGDRTVFRVFDLKKKKKFNGTTHRSTVHCPPQKYVGKNLMFHGRKIPGNNRGSSQQVHFRLKRTAVGKN